MGKAAMMIIRGPNVHMKWLIIHRESSAQLHSEITIINTNSNKSIKYTHIIQLHMQWPGYTIS